MDASVHLLKLALLMHCVFGHFQPINIHVMKFSVKFFLLQAKKWLLAKAEQSSTDPYRKCWVIAGWKYHNFSLYTETVMITRRLFRFDDRKCTTPDGITSTVSIRFIVLLLVVNMNILDKIVCCRIIILNLLVTAWAVSPASECCGREKKSSATVLYHFQLEQCLFISFKLGLFE